MKAAKKKSKFNLASYIVIPFSNAPLLTLTLFVDQIIVSLIPSFIVVLTGQFLDSAIAVLNNTAGSGPLIRAIVSIICVLAYQHLSAGILGVVNEYLLIRLTMNFKKDIMTKHANLEYRYIENADTCDVINRVCDEPPEKIMNGFNQILGVLYLAVMYSSILAIVTRFVW
jgi:ATP-binding cassette subfamily B protein